MNKMKKIMHFTYQTCLAVKRGPMTMANYLAFVYFCKQDGI